MRGRLLEGFLRRLARYADADAFALRGGMLVHTWVPEAKRTVRDIDLSCVLPLDTRAMRRRVRAVLANHVDDGVVFDAGRVRLDRWLDLPGLTLYAAGEVDGQHVDMVADLWFDLDIAAERGVVPTSRGPISMQLCPHELVIATKLGVIADLGPHEWRAKDLADVWLGLKRFPPDRRIGDAIERFAGERWQEMLSATWWREPRVEMRWARRGVPAALDAVVAEVRHLLAPFGARR